LWRCSDISCSTFPKSETAREAPTIRAPAAAPSDAAPDFAARALAAARRFVDPYAAKLAASVLAGSDSPATSSKSKTAEKPRFAEPGPGFSFSYAELSNSASELPEGVDPSRREMYLHEADFEKALGRPRAEFEQLRPWRQGQLKKAAGLF